MCPRSMVCAKIRKLSFFSSENYRFYSCKRLEQAAKIANLQTDTMNSMSILLLVIC